MKYVEFGGMDDDDAEGEVSSNQLGLSLPSPNPSKAMSQQQNASLETLLAAKNKRISDELTKLRVSNSHFRVKIYDECWFVIERLC